MQGAAPETGVSRAAAVTVPYCPRSRRRYRCSGCRAGIGGAPPIRPRWCKASTPLRRVTTLWQRQLWWRLSDRRRRVCVYQHLLAADRPVVEAGRRLVRIAPPSPSRRRTARVRPARRTRTTGRLSRQLAFSYLGNNWVASANFFYDINTKSQGVCCVDNGSITSGNALFGDFTAVYKLGKWSIGPVGYFEVQTTNDTGTCNPVIAGVVANSSAAAIGPFAAGGLVGYDFGPVDLQVWVTDHFVSAEQPEQATAVSTSGRASASRSGDLSNRWRRSFLRCKLATALLSRPCGKPRGLFLCPDPGFIA